MVMKRNIMVKNLFQSIRCSIGRYIAIVAIIALGAAMFVGLLTTRSDMIVTAQKFTDEQNMFHLNLLSSYGWTDNELEAISKMDGIRDAEGTVTLDVIAKFGESGEDQVYRLHAIPKLVDQVYLLGGRMPRQPDECLVDGSKATDAVLGQKLIISDTNDQDALDSVNQKVFTVVGYVSTPLYMDLNRGSTTIGNGSLETYVYILPDAFTVDYYSQISITLPGTYEIYSAALDSAMEQSAEDLKPQLTALVQSRFDELKADALQEYNDGLQEYEQGKADYEEGKAEADREFAKAEQDLLDGQKEIDENLALLEDGEAQLRDAREELKKNENKLAQSQKELDTAKSQAYEQLTAAREELMSNYETALAGQKELTAGLEQLNAGLTQLETGLKQINTGLEQLTMAIGLLNTGVEATQKLINAELANPEVDEQRLAMLEQELATQKQKLEQYILQKAELVLRQGELTAQLTELQTQKLELETQKETVDGAVAQLEMGIRELDSKQQETDKQFAQAEAQLESGRAQLKKGQKEVSSQQAKIDEGREELEQAQVTLDEGRAELIAEKAKAEQELADAKLELDDAKLKLDDALETINSMKEPELFILDRNTNPGYLAVQSNADILSGVSRVFPVFFLLIAALVCITTLTKMVDEERTQIGVLKAMGHSGSAIMGKYLFYCGSAAILGCGLGVLAGSVVFPQILWAAYRIMMCLTPRIQLRLDVPLCLAVVTAYTAVSLLVTWYCCHKELREVPAQLMRPKAPTPGKKILMEHLPFWDKISFLNKVMFRNVFRYRQRMLMMLLGVGGCTALLLTGFGIRDTIGDFTSYQFAEVSVYDMEVYFAQGKNDQEQEAFRQQMSDRVDQVLFYHRSSVDMEFKGKTKPVDLIATDRDLQEFIKLKSDGCQLGVPQEGEIYLSVGIAEFMGIREGDQVTLRNADLKETTVTVAELFENHVNNYLIIRPQTLRQWNHPLEQQMAMVNVSDTNDVREVGAQIVAMEDVMSVSVNQDIADSVSVMMEALDLVVVTVVICAALLAVIVLYNLTNISITERIREIATIKVLGFNSRESAAYVFKENLLLSAMGACLGLVGGIFLLQFVVSQIKIDIVWFQPRLTFMSYVWSLLLTMVSACLVDFLLYFKLEKINMAEALKSVE